MQRRNCKKRLSLDVKGLIATSRPVWKERRRANVHSKEKGRRVIQSSRGCREQSLKKRGKEEALLDHGTPEARDHLLKETSTAEKKICSRGLVL